MVDHESPPFRLTHAPPSLPCTIRRVFRGSIQISWLSPWGIPTSVKFRPPSTDFHALKFMIQTVSASCGSAKMWL